MYNAHGISMMVSPSLSVAHQNTDTNNLKLKAQSHRATWWFAGVFPGSRSANLPLQPLPCVTYHHCFSIIRTHVATQGTQSRGLSAHSLINLFLLSWDVLVIHLRTFLTWATRPHCLSNFRHFGITGMYKIRGVQHCKSGLVGISNTMHCSLKLDRFATVYFGSDF